MFQDLNVFQLAHSMANHAGKRQALVAQNMANADTPGYRSRDIVPFAEAVSKGQIGRNDTTQQRAPIGAGQWEEFTPSSAVDPNGNGVSIEQEMLKAVETTRQHERALSIYRSSLSILRTSLGRA